MGQKTNLIKSLKKFAQEVSKKCPVNSMYLFGSRAAGRVREGSDVDLLLVSTGFIGKRRLKRAPSLYLTWNLKYPVDFICLTPEEFKKKKKEIGIVQEAIRTGIKVI